MERLTELKVGQEIPVEVLNNFVNGNNTYANTESGSFYSNGSISKTPTIRKVLRVLADRFTVSTNADTLYFNIKGFVEFYNKFYGLDTQPTSRIEDWHNCVFYCNSFEEYDKLKKALVVIGFEYGAKYVNDAYVRTETHGKELSSGNYRSGWAGFLKNPREFEYEEAIAALTNKLQPMSTQRTKFEKRDFFNTKLDLPDWETCQRFSELLRLVGIVTDNKFIKKEWLGTKGYYTIFISRCGSLTFSSTNGLREFETGNEIVRWQDYLTETVAEKQLINTNNTPLNNKTDGNKIIVCKPHPRITSGQRPESRGITGKKGRTAITSGHYSYRGISS